MKEKFTGIYVDLIGTKMEQFTFLTQIRFGEFNLYLFKVDN